MWLQRPIKMLKKSMGGGGPKTGSLEQTPTSIWIFYLNWVSRLAEMSGYFFSRVVSDLSFVWGQPVK